MTTDRPDRSRPTATNVIAHITSHITCPQVQRSTSSTATAHPTCPRLPRHYSRRTTSVVDATTAATNFTWPSESGLRAPAPTAIVSTTLAGPLLGFTPSSCLLRVRQHYVGCQPIVSSEARAPALCRVPTPCHPFVSSEARAPAQCRVPIHRLVCYACASTQSGANPSSRLRRVRQHCVGCQPLVTHLSRLRRARQHNVGCQSIVSSEARAPALSRVPTHRFVTSSRL